MQALIMLKASRDKFVERATCRGVPSPERQHGRQVMLNARLLVVTLLASGHLRQLAALRWQEETSRDYVITRVGGTLAPTLHAALAPISLAAHFPFLLPLYL